MAESTLSLSAEKIETWTGWARRDDWHNLFVGSEIRQMLGEIGRLHTTLAAEIERREMAEKAREDCYQANLLIRAQQKEDYARAETAERALADAQECIEQKDASLLRGADAMTKDAEFIRSLKAELAAYRAPVDDIEAHVEHHVTAGDEFTDGMGGPEHRELVPADIARQLAATIRERDGRIAGLEKDATRLDFVIGRQAFIDTSPPREEHGTLYQLWRQDENETIHIISGAGRFFASPRAAIDAALTQPTGLEKQS